MRPGDRRKIILSTNVAESSVTIEGVTAVIDSGLARIAAHSPWTGLPTLALARISQAAATQRAGRAGRTRPGRALRLYTRHDFEQRPARDRARDRARRSDRAGAGAGDARRERRGCARLARPAARRGLGRRARAAPPAGRDRSGGASDRRRPPHVAPPRPPAAGAPRRRGRGARRRRGRRAGRGADLRARHPADRARVLRRRRRPGAPPIAAPTCSTWSICSSRRPRRAFARTCCAAWSWTAARPRRSIASRRQLARRRRPRAARRGDDALRLAILAAFPDRVARRREPRARAVVFAAGGSAELGYEAAGDWLVAVDAEERTHARGGDQERADRRRRGAARLDDRARMAAGALPRSGRGRRSPRLRSRAPIGSSARPACATARSCSTRRSRPRRSTTRPRGCSPTRCSPAGRSGCPGGEALPPLLQRLAFARRQTPEAPLPPLDDGGVAGWCARPAWAAAASPSSAIRRRWCSRRCRPTRSARWRPPRPNGSRSRAGAACRSTTTSATRPGSNRACRISSARARCPALGAGRVALTVHLLAPNGRAVQVTRDLESFWAQHYPALRRATEPPLPQTRLARGRRHRQAAPAPSPAPPAEMTRRRRRTILLACSRSFPGAKRMKRAARGWPRSWAIARR